MPIFPLSAADGRDVLGRRASTSGQYDAVGNRLVYTHTFSSQAVRTCTCDAANRLTNVDGQTHTWDNNSNPSASSGQALLSDGE